MRIKFGIGPDFIWTKEVIGGQSLPENGDWVSKTIKSEMFLGNDEEIFDLVAGIEYTYILKVR